ncbi:MAG: 16S rRNA (guanine(527)-N(7))-methyltransferase RsmG [Roseburia sp.]|nr:16S rRNA (guanine(527)-N(7))-methyltransferase RsmG [Anaeroplasma bactoclasticum]MCM1196392.1 16S rRNA (guanine(527)-N(7))-methyltransferase RsmG [Roseburia sp.]MCM1556158.1 16S rRNA (guanine(527)-N(7))-methyltransferase RsmG [Anaeroplasma bactoclasticum]
MNFHNELEKLGIVLDERKIKQFEEYYLKLIEVNQVMNLTAITEKDEVYRKHFLDSLEIVRVLKDKENYTLCDVGSGAGFPSIPLAVVQNNVHITIIDALNKRINFLNALIKDLELSNVEAIHARAEDYVKEKREYFDVVTARAVARLNILAELCLPLTKVGGLFLAMKGSSGNEELLEARNAIEQLGGKVLDIVRFTLPDEEEQRQIIVIQKIKDTPAKFPRNFNKIKEQPL